MDRLKPQPLAEIAVEEVRSALQGFTLSGKGRDGAEYELYLRFEMPLDPKTRAVLGELLSQAEVTVSRWAATGSGGPARQRERAHNP